MHHKFRWYFMLISYKRINIVITFDETIENTDRIHGGRSFEAASGSREKEKKEVKWKTSPLAAHAARIAKPTLCVCSD